MTDVFERAQAREAQLRDDALAEQARRAGLLGKTPADSAEICRVCDGTIPEDRRAGPIPGRSSASPVKATWNTGWRGLRDES